MRNILIRAANWVGDAVMSLPALRALRDTVPGAKLTILARPWVADLYRREPFCDELILWNAERGAKDIATKWRIAQNLRTRKFDTAILLQNAFEAAAVVRAAGIARRIGYSRDGRGWLLTDAIAVPAKGEIPEHEGYYYLELLRRAGIIRDLPSAMIIRLEQPKRPRRDIVGVSPGAAFGTAKQWLPERFADAAAQLAREIQGQVAVFGTSDESALCGEVAAAIEAHGVGVTNHAGKTTLSEFIDLASECRIFLSNDSGGMHIASALGIPTVTVFGATNHITTGPTGPLARVVREPVDCAPCLLRECPIDHRCMTRVETRRVVDVALELLSSPLLK